MVAAGDEMADRSINKKCAPATLTFCRRPARKKTKHKTKLAPIKRSLLLVYLSVGIADQDHLLKQLAVWGCLRNNLPEHQQQLLDGVVLKRQHKADYGHQQPGQFLTIQDHDDDLLQGFSLGFDFALFCKEIYNFDLY